MTGKFEKSQKEKFKEAAREIGADESEEAFDEKLMRLAQKPDGKKPEERGNN